MYAAEVSSDRVKTVLEALKGAPIFPHVMVLLSTGMRRGELMSRMQASSAKGCEREQVNACSRAIWRSENN